MFRIRRFSLRGLFLLTTLFVVAMAYWVHRIQLEQRVHLRVEMLGGAVNYDTTGDQASSFLGSPSGQPPPIKDTQYASAFLNWRLNRHIDTIRLPAQRLDDETLQLIAQLPKLRALFSEQTTSSSDRHAPRLSATQLNGFGIADSFPGQITADDAVDKSPPATDHDTIAQPVTDVGLAALAKSSKLEALVLCDTRITDEGLAVLPEMPHLQLLHLMSPHITDAAVEQLARIPSLRCLFVEGTAISSHGVGELKRALPNCWIITGDMPSLSGGN